jgi:iron complex transport system substrate-binding protein
MTFKPFIQNLTEVNSKMKCLFFLALLALGGCATQEAPTAEVPAAATRPRIVALTSLSADLVHRLDPDHLVGMPGGSLFQDNAAFEGITVVSQGQTPPQIEKIVALEPDLVIGARGFHDPVLAQLEDSGIRTLTTEISRWPDLTQLMETLAQETGTDAAPLQTRLNQCFEQAPAQTESVLVLVSRQPLLSPNANSWAGDFLARFNAQNVTAQMQGQSPFEGYVTLSSEKVLTANPDILVLVDAGEDLVAQMKSEPFWQDLKAVQTDQVHVVDYYGLVNPGSLDSIEQTCQRLAQILNP